MHEFRAQRQSKFKENQKHSTHLFIFENFQLSALYCLETIVRWWMKSYMIASTACNVSPLSLKTALMSNKSLGVLRILQDGDGKFL